MQKSLIVLVVGLLAVGCGKKFTPEEKALRDSVIDSVIGEYRNEADNYKQFVLENGIVYIGAHDDDGYKTKWAIVDV